jgi:4-amino-4-deoxy-L-arabinose transferase-like glycosyltransferase
MSSSKGYKEFSKGMSTAIATPGRALTLVRPETHRMKRLHLHPLWIVVPVALLIRLIVATLIFRDMASPAGHYQDFGQEVGWIARSIALGHGFSSPFFPQTGPTAMLPPLYPFLLSLIFRVFGVYTAKSALAALALNSLFSSVTCIPIYFAAQYATNSAQGACNSNSKLAKFAAWAWAVYPFAIYFSAARVWEYALTSLLLTTCFLVAQRLHPYHPRLAWLGFGLLFGITALSNPAVLLLFPFFLFFALWRLHRNRTAWLQKALLTLLGLLAILAPWTARNYRTMHVFCLVRDNFWEEFWAGNTGDTSSPMPGWTHPASDDAEMKIYQASGEVAYIVHKHDLAVDFIDHHKLFFAKLTLRRAAYIWTGFWSLDPSYVHSEPFQFPNIFFCTGLTVLMLFGARSWWRTDRRLALPYLTAIFVFPLTYYISHPLMDYRQPIEPEIVMVVVMGLFELQRKFSSRAHNNDLSLVEFAPEETEDLVAVAMELTPIT